MIVREIAEHPELIDDFDWFNDYDDTRQWAKNSCPEMVGLLDYGFGRYRRERITHPLANWKSDMDDYVNSFCGEEDDDD